jgi:exodeoxyribonuclease V beta subunit
MLEMLAEFDVQSIMYAKDMMLNKYGHILEDEEIEDILRRVKMLLQNEEFLSLLGTECYREKAIRHKKNLKYIDLLVRDDSQKETLFDSWNVIDYKSAISHTGEHLKQVRNYVKAVEEITSESAKGYIVYLLEESIKIVKV